MTNTVDAWVFRLGTGGLFFIVKLLCILFYSFWRSSCLVWTHLVQWFLSKKYSYHDVYDGVMDGT